MFVTCTDVAINKLQHSDKLNYVCLPCRIGTCYYLPCRYVRTRAGGVYLVGWARATVWSDPRAAESRKLVFDVIIM